MSAPLITHEITLKNGVKIGLRTAVPDDAASLIQTIRSYAADSDYLLLTPEEFQPAVEQERAWIRSFQTSNNSLLLLAFNGDDLIGNIDLTGSPRQKLSHTAVVGMGMLREWRGLGLGTALLQEAIAWARHNPHLELLWLQVYHNNEAGLALYRKCGFTEQGRQPAFIKLSDGRYADNVLMGLSVLS